MIAEYDHVRVKATGETGIVLAYVDHGEFIVYTVESDQSQDGYWPRRFVKDDEIELIR